MKSEQQLISEAKQYVKDCHVIGIVNALEGGVIYLESLLSDFYNRATRITIDEFKALPDGQPFAIGCSTNTPDGLYLTDKGGDLKWVAVKGYANDWAIYVHWINSSIDYIISNGDKLQSITHIKRCVLCTNDVYDLYRY